MPRTDQSSHVASRTDRASRRLYQAGLARYTWAMLEVGTEAKGKGKAMPLPSAYTRFVPGRSPSASSSNDSTQNRINYGRDLADLAHFEEIRAENELDAALACETYMRREEDLHQQRLLEDEDEQDYEQSLLDDEQEYRESLFEKQQQDDDEQQCCDSPSVASAVVAAFLDDLVTSLRAIKDRTRRLAKLREAIRILHGCKDVSFSSVEKNYIAQHVAGGAGSFTKEELASEEDFCENHDRRM
jgi:hypothetical protein